MDIQLENLPQCANKLKNMVVELAQEIKSLEKKLNNQTHRVSFLEEHIRLMTLRRFRKSSECYIDSKQPLIFDEIEQEAQQEIEEKPSEIDVQPHKRQRGKRQKLPEGLPRIRQEFDLSAEEKICSQHNVEMKRIGEEVSEQLEVVPARVQVIQNVRFKYACPCCDESPIKTSPMPAQIIPKSNASAGLLAHIATAKYEDHLPLYRQEKIFQRQGIDLPRATTARWLIKAAEACRPLINLMQEDLLSGQVLQCDETTLQVLKEEDRPADAKSYMWVLARGDPLKPLILYHYAKTRAAYVIEELLGGYQGYLQMDGYSGYSSFVKHQPAIIHVGCFAHARRYFFEAQKAGKKAGGNNLIATRALQLFQKLYKIEKQIKGKSFDEIFDARQKLAKPILEEIRTWLDKNLDKVLDSSLAGKALKYLHSEWHKLIRYIDDGRLSIDNNYCENKIRPFCLGRKNWMFADTPAGAEASAILYSLIETAKANDIHPYDYLRLIFTLLPRAKTLEDYEKLLAYNVREHYGDKAIF